MIQGSNGFLFRLSKSIFMYNHHPSPRLNELFAKRPYQGVDPIHAKYVFIGLDANYAEDVDQIKTAAEIYEWL